MPESNANPKLTKAGVVLTAEARARLQRLANWMEVELVAPQNPRVRLSYLGGLVTIGETTYMTPLAALVQMYYPFKLSDATEQLSGMYKIDASKLHFRIREMLGITPVEYYQILGYIYHRVDLQDVVQTLRTLK